MPGFKDATEHGATGAAGADAARAAAHLPGLSIEITHRHASEGDAEHVSINLKAVPSFDAFAHAFEAANPFARRRTPGPRERTTRRAEQFKQPQLGSCFERQRTVAA
ncbi:MAG: hypothetical protein K2Z80_18960 [Xanthobacteraceae bacterium]|nr:hypothetical protein [Xanthobacteraceae bacterium]